MQNIADLRETSLKLTLRAISRAERILRFCSTGVQLGRGILSPLISLEAFSVFEKIPSSKSHDKH